MCGPNLRELLVLSYFIIHTIKKKNHGAPTMCQAGIVLGVGETAVNGSHGAHILGQTINKQVIIIVDVCIDRSGKMPSNAFINIAVERVCRKRG